MISRDVGRYAVSVVPERPHITFARRVDAIKLARKMARAKHVAVWHIGEDEIVQLLREKARNKAIRVYLRYDRESS